MALTGRRSQQGRAHTTRERPPAPRRASPVRRPMPLRVLPGRTLAQVPAARNASARGTLRELPGSRISKAPAAEKRGRLRWWKMAAVAEGFRSRSPPAVLRQRPGLSREAPLAANSAAYRSPDGAHRRTARTALPSQTTGRFRWRQMADARLRSPCAKQPEVRWHRPRLAREAPLASVEAVVLCPRRAASSAAQSPRRRPSSLAVRLGRIGKESPASFAAPRSPAGDVCSQKQALPSQTTGRRFRCRKMADAGFRSRHTTPPGVRRRRPRLAREAPLATVETVVLCPRRAALSEAQSPRRHPGSLTVRLGRIGKESPASFAVPRSPAGAARSQKQARARQTCVRFRWRQMAAEGLHPHRTSAPAAPPRDSSPSRSAPAPLATSETVVLCPEPAACRDAESLACLSNSLPMRPAQPLGE